MKQTSRVELVETHSIALALERLSDGAKNGYDTVRWRRALYHALAMTRVATHDELKAIREALGLA